VHLKLREDGTSTVRQTPEVLQAFGCTAATKGCRQRHRPGLRSRTGPVMTSAARNVPLAESGTSVSELRTLLSEPAWIFPAFYISFQRPSDVRSNGHERSAAARTTRLGW
jgi:hypothetical protein